MWSPVATRPLFKSRLIAIAAIALGILLASAARPTFADDRPSSSPAETLQTLDSLYWLGRARPWSLVEPSLSKELAAQIDTELLSDADRARFESLRKEADVELEERQGNLGSVSPVLGLYVDADPVIEWADEQVDVAIERALDRLFGAGSRIQITDQQLLLITVVDEALGEAGREVADAWLNDNTRGYVIATHEIAGALGEELSTVELIEDPESLRRVCRHFFGPDVEVPNVGVVSLELKGEIGRAAHVSALFRSFDLETGIPSRPWYADGLAQHAGPRALLVVSILLLVALPLSCAPRLLRLVGRRGNNVPGDPLPPIWLGIGAAVLAIPFCALTRAGVVLAEVDPGIPLVTVKAKGLAIALPVVIQVLPVLLVMLVLPRVKSVSARLHERDVLWMLFGGAWVGGQAYLSQYWLAVEGVVIALRVAILMSLAGIAVAFAMATVWRFWERTGARFELVKFGVLVTAAVALAVAGWQGTLVTLVIACSVVVIAAFAMLAWKAGGSREAGGDASDDSGSGASVLDFRDPRFVDTPASTSMFNQIIEHFLGADSEDEAIEVAWLEGGRGSGKTRLAEELGRRVSKEATRRGVVEDFVIAFGDCDEPGDPQAEVPLEPFRQALGDLIGLDRFQDPSARIRAMQAGLKKVAEKGPMVGGAIALALDVGQGDESGQQRANHAVLAEAIASALEVRTSPVDAGDKGCRVLMVLDDVQWMDESSVQLFRVLLTRISDRFRADDRLHNRFGIVLTARTDVDRESSARAGEVREILSEFIGRGELKLLTVDRFDARLGDEENASAWLDGFFTQTNATERARRVVTRRLDELGLMLPLHRLEFLTLAREQGLIREVEGRLDVVAGTDLAGVSAGRSFEEMAARELDGLSPRLVEILQCCAMMGRGFRPSIIAKIFQMDELDVLAELGVAEARGIVVDELDRDDHYHFQDKRLAGIFRSAAGSNSEHVRQMVREYHARFVIARSSEIDARQEDPDRLPLGDLMALAHHAGMVRDRMPREAVVWCLRASRRCHRECLFERAVSTIEPALQLVSRDGLDLDAALRLEVLGLHLRLTLDAGEELDVAAQSLAIARSLLHDDPSSALLQAEFANLASLLAYRRRDFEQAKEEAELALRFASPGSMESYRARFNVALAMSPTPAEPRIAVLEGILAMAEESATTDRESPAWLVLKSEVLNQLGSARLWGLRDDAAASIAFAEALELNRDPRVADRKGEAISLGGLGDICKVRADSVSDPARATELRQEALGHYRANLRISLETGDRQGIIRMNSMIGGLLLDLAETGATDEPDAAWRDARGCYERSLHAAESVGNAMSMRLAFEGLVRVERHSGGNGAHLLEYLEAMFKAGFCKFADQARALLEALATKEVTESEASPLEAVLDEIRNRLVLCIGDAL